MHQRDLCLTFDLCKFPLSPRCIELGPKTPVTVQWAVHRSRQVDDIFVITTWRRCHLYNPTWHLPQAKTHSEQSENVGWFCEETEIQSSTFREQHLLFIRSKYKGKKNMSVSMCFWGQAKLSQVAMLGWQASCCSPRSTCMVQRERTAGTDGQWEYMALCCTYTHMHTNHRADPGDKLQTIIFLDLSSDPSSITPLWTETASS